MLDVAVADDHLDEIYMVMEFAQHVRISSFVALCYGSVNDVGQDLADLIDYSAAKFTVSEGW